MFSVPTGQAIKLDLTYITFEFCLQVNLLSDWVTTTGKVLRIFYSLVSHRQFSYSNTQNLIQIEIIQLFKSIDIVQTFKSNFIFHFKVLFLIKISKFSVFALPGYLTLLNHDDCILG